MLLISTLLTGKFLETGSETTLNNDWAIVSAEVYHNSQTQNELTPEMSIDDLRN